MLLVGQCQENQTEDSFDRRQTRCLEDRRESVSQSDYLDRIEDDREVRRVEIVDDESLITEEIKRVR